MNRFLSAMVAAAIAAPALAHEPSVLPAPDDRSIFVFGGRIGASDMGEMLNPVTADYEDAIILGGGYQHFLAEPIEHLRIGVEAGAAIRSGEQTTGEVWAGLVGRYDGLVIGDRIRVSPSVTFGASAVTDTMGVEADREAIDGLPGNLLFYFSPEISISDVENPGTEFFWRLHHRSGAWNTFGGGGSANATTFGIRMGF